MDGINPQNAFQQGLQAWQVGANIGQQQQARQMAEQQQQRAQQYKDMLAKVISNPASTAQDYLMLQAQFPEQAKAIKDLEAQQSDAENKNDLLVKMQLLNAVRSGDKEALNRFASQQIEAYKNSGRDTKAQGLQMILDQYENVPPEVTEGSLVNSIAAQMDNPKDFIDYYDRLQARTAKGAEGLKGRVQPHTETTPDGTVWTVNDKGEVTVTDITGRKLEGEEARQAWLKGKEYGVDIAKRTNFSREEGKLEAQKGLKAEIEEEVTYAKKGTEAAIKKSEEFGKSADMAGQRIEKLDNAINVAESAIAEGKSLGKGWFQNRVPKISKYRVLMQQAARDLGLGVIQSTTFGALSKGEMDLAMETALPPLNDKDLLDWLKRRRAAEEKIQNELSRAAIFLSQPGNTVGKWRKLQLDIRAGKITPEQSYGEQPTAAPADMTQQTTELRTQPDFKSIPVAERLKMLQGP